MAEEFDWAPKRVRLGLRFALGVAIMRLSVGLLVLLIGVGLAVMHFRPPPEPAGIDQIMLSQSAENSLSTSSISRSGAGGGVTRPTPASTTPGPWARNTVVVASRNVSDEAVDRLSGTDLTRSLQSELQRVGCYHGAIDGDWGPMSKRAMSEFTGHMNASLPVDRPDQILLHMVRGFSGRACGGPASVVAGADNSDGNRPVEPLPGRMAVGGPVEADANVPLTRYVAAEEPRAASPESSDKPRQTTRRSRVAERSSPAPYYRSPQNQRKSWIDRVFNPSGP